MVFAGGLFYCCIKYTLPIFTILVAMGGSPQTYMIKARIAPRSGAPAMLHTFAPRPAAAALAALRCYVLMCAALTNRKRFVKMSANAHASMAFAAAFLAALIILVFTEISASDQSSFISPSLIIPALRKGIAMMGVRTAGRTMQIRISPIQSIPVMPAFVPAAISLIQPV